MLFLFSSWYFLPSFAMSFSLNLLNYMTLSFKFKWLFLFKKSMYVIWPCLHFSSIYAIHSWASLQFKQYTSELLFNLSYIQLDNVFISRSASLNFIIKLNLDNFSSQYQLAFFWLMKTTHCNNFFVFYLILSVWLNYIELHHFNFVICLSFNVNVFLQTLQVLNIALVNNRNDFRHLVILLRKFKLQGTNSSWK